MVSGQDEVAEFAGLLRRFKERTDRSYGSLARRLGMNTSTLHRYCAGDAVPQDFAPVERFAALCGASAEERMELHRLWLLAVAARQRPKGAQPEESAEPQEAEPTQAEPAEAEPAEAEPAEAAAPEEPAATPAPPEEEPAATPAPPEEEDATPAPQPHPAPPPGPRPWYRRRRVTVAAAVAAVLLATVGTLTALDTDGNGRGNDGRRTGAGPGTSAPADPRRTSPAPTTVSPSPSGSRSTSEGGSAKPSSPQDGPTTGAQSTQKGKPVSGVPLTWSADSHVWAEGCGHDYVIDRPPARVAPPPPAQDARTWAGSQGAVHGRETIVRISVQGRTSTAVVLEALRVRVVGRTAPLQGNAYAMDQGCGGALTPRFFSVDLDKDRPIARPMDGSDAGTPIPAMRLPYRVSAEDPEVLLVTARTEGCACDWYLELDWSSQGRTGTIRVDDDGRPFRTTAIKGLPRYLYDTEAREWGPYA
nr:helix-turn-helix domain-containing protein [Streptomyces sp. SBE_14.2]